METKKTAFRLSRTKGGSDRFGPCECCGKHADSIYIMSRMSVYIRQDGVEGLSHESSLFGHKQCLAAQTSGFDEVA